MIQETVLAYTAGLLDGEGHYGIGRITKPLPGGLSFVFVPRLRVGMNHKPTMDWLKKQFGGSLSQRSATNKAETSYVWSIGGEPQLRSFLPLVAVFARTKQIHALLLLDFLQKFPGCGRTAINIGERLEEMNKYYEIMRALNSVGPGSSEKKEELSKILTLVNSQPDIVS